MFRGGGEGRREGSRRTNRRSITPNTVSRRRFEPTGHIPRPRWGPVVPALFPTRCVGPFTSAVQPFRGSAHKVWASRSRGHSRCPCPAAGVRRCRPPRAWSGGRPSLRDARPPQFSTGPGQPSRSAVPAVCLRRVELASNPPRLRCVPAACMRLSSMTELRLHTAPLPSRRRRDLRGGFGSGGTVIDVDAASPRAAPGVDSETYRIRYVRAAAQRRSDTAPLVVLPHASTTRPQPQGAAGHRDDHIEQA